MEKIVETDGKGNKVESRSIAGETRHNVSGVKQCKKCQDSFTITDRDMEFYDKISPIFGGKKYSVPTPTFCPDCRQQRRLSFRNERKLYKRKCDFTGKDIVSIYSPDKAYKVYDTKARWDDGREPMNYGMDVDFNKNFIQQYEKLLQDLPHLSLFAGVESNENSDYANHITNLKDCYMVFNSYFGENCYYGNELLRGKNMIDFYNVSDSENIYEAVNCSSCYKVFFANNCHDCNTSYFINECYGVDHCIDCHNLHNKSYHYKNNPISKEEFDLLVKDIFSEDVGYKKDDNTYHKAQNIVASEDCTGNDIVSSKNCEQCYDIKGSQDCKYCYNSFDITDCMDIYTRGRTSQLMYNSTCVGNNNHNIICCHAGVSKSRNMLYCGECQSCDDCFGCSGLKMKQYCILNKQYTKEEYEKEIPKIIEKMTADGERGEFFSSSLSPFGYNETVAQEYFPLNKEEALAQGFKRSDYEAPFPQADAKDVIVCEVSGKPFRLIPQEIEFYKTHNLPLPIKHPDIRHQERMKLRNPRKLWNRKCDKCEAGIKTSYSPERPEVVYCESCYNQKIYG